MAFSIDYLNNVGSSAGNSTLWIYDEPVTAAVGEAAGYMNDATKSGLRDGDVIMCLWTDERYFVRATVSAGVVTFNPFVQYTP
jgi:hypothetical protein